MPLLTAAEEIEDLTNLKVVSVASAHAKSNAKQRNFCDSVRQISRNLTPHNSLQPSKEAYFSVKFQWYSTLSPQSRGHKLHTILYIQVETNA